MAHVKVIHAVESLSCCLVFYCTIYHSLFAHLNGFQKVFLSDCSPPQQHCAMCLSSSITVFCSFGDLILLHFLPMWLAAPFWSSPLTLPASLSLECCIWSCGLTDHPDTEDSQISFTSLDLRAQIYSHTPNCALDISPCTLNRKLKGSLVGWHNSGFLSSPPKPALIPRLSQ